MFTISVVFYRNKTSICCWIKYGWKIIDISKKNKRTNVLHELSKIIEANKDSSSTYIIKLISCFCFHLCNHISKNKVLYKCLTAVIQGTFSVSFSRILKRSNLAKSQHNLPFYKHSNPIISLRLFVKDYISSLKIHKITTRF